MANYDASNPYVREAVAAGVNEPWIAGFMRSNPNDYHRILAAAAGDVGAYSGPPGNAVTGLTLTTLSDNYQAQIRPGAAGGASLAALGTQAGGLLFLAALALAGWYLYKRVL